MRIESELILYFLFIMHYIKTLILTYTILVFHVLYFIKYIKELKNIF